MKKFPRAIAGLTVQGHRSLMVWECPGAGAGEIHRLRWENGGAEVVLLTMTDPGTYHFNNWDNSQHGEPSKWEVVGRYPADNPRAADDVMREVARERFGVVQFA